MPSTLPFQGWNFTKFRWKLRRNSFDFSTMVDQLWWSILPREWTNSYSSLSKEKIFATGGGQIYSNYELCSFIKTLLGIVVTEKAATRMKFDAVSSKAVGTISDYQQPRQNRVFGKSSFVIRTVSADYECLAQALRYAHPLPLLLTRRKRVLSFLDDSLPQFPTILLRARASLHEFRIHCANILPWKSSAPLDIAGQTFVFVQRAVGHRSNAVNFKIGGGKMEEIGKGIETGFGFQSYALCLVLRVFEARGEGDWSSSTCPTLLGRFMEGKLASSSHFQVVSGHVNGLD